MLLALTAMSFAGIAVAAPNSYPAFSDDDAIDSCPLIDIPEESSSASDATKRYTFAGNSIEIQDRDLQLLMPTGPRFDEPLTIFGSTIGFDTVRTTDLNRDGTPDFVVTSWSGGSGLAAGFAGLTIFLSNGDSYSAHLVETNAPAPTDFFRLPGSDECLLVQTSYIHASGDFTSDSKPHSFWAHNLLRFSGSEILAADAAVPGFPKWIWFTYRPNSQPTTLLSEQSKKALWDNRSFGHVRRPDDSTSTRSGRE